MFEPYRWIEDIANRREYIEERIRGGSPVVGISYEDGLLLLTTTRGGRKIFEVYDRIALSAIGHPADIEKLREIIIDAAHLEGFMRSPEDVTLRRLSAFVLAPAMKQAFDEIFRSPYIARIMLAEIDRDGKATFCRIDYDGSFQIREGFEVIGDTEESERAMREEAEGKGIGNASLPLKDAMQEALKIWAKGKALGCREEGQKDIADILSEELKAGRIEASILCKSLPTTSKFQELKEEEISRILEGIRDKL